MFCLVTSVRQYSVHSYYHNLIFRIFLVHLFGWSYHLQRIECSKKLIFIVYDATLNVSYQYEYIKTTNHSVFSDRALAYEILYQAAYKKSLKIDAAALIYNQRLY